MKHFPIKKLIAFPALIVWNCANLLHHRSLFIKAIMHSDISAGFYTANQNIAEFPTCLTALATVLFPSISRHVSNIDTMSEKLTSSLRFCLSSHSCVYCYWTCREMLGKRTVAVRSEQSRNLGDV